MKQLSELNKKNIKYVFTDIDDTLTNDGKLISESYEAMWRLSQSGIKIIPITGRPAGWCELIARMWPVDAVVGENGGFYFTYKNSEMIRKFQIPKAQRIKNQKKLKKIEEEVLSSVPGSAVASDQFCRMMDLAIDFCEDVPALSNEDVDKIVDIFKKHGAQAKVSSIHVNGWFGDYNKLSMCKIYVEDYLNLDLEKNNEQFCFVGDSPNDEPMFEFFENSIGVKNVEAFLSKMSHPPKFLTTQEGGYGFKQVADHLLS
ncbi:MAG: HAD-IIB family hydrolase [Bdellovibrionales bacterium]|nr:HAD-IIB family hydrolase [Bdellovibrionales bacterium]